MSDARSVGAASAFPQTTLVKAERTEWSGDIPLKRIEDIALAHSGGLTKRELFAAMAMQGMASNETLMLSHTDVGECLDPKLKYFEVTAKCAVDYADALLAELAKGAE